MQRAKAFSFPAICGIVHLALLSAACGQSPVSPSILPPAIVTLTIVARDSRTGAVLPDIRAYASTLQSCTTKDDGVCRMDIPNGVTVTVAIWGTGYAGQVRTSTVSGASRWTFDMRGE